MPRLSRFLATTRNVARAATLITLCVPAYAWSQPPDTGAAPDAIAADPPAHVSFVDGSAVLERDGQPDSAPANMPLLSGDRIRTQEGRVEILFADGSTLHLDANTTVDFQSDELVRLLDGRVRLAIPGPANRRVAYRIDAPSASALILQAGEFKVSILHSTRDGEIELAVLRGAAELVNDDGRTPLRAGERAYARANGAPSYAYAYNSAAWDGFDRWSEARRDQRIGVSTQYLPEEIRPYASAFDQYGTWQYQPTYGYVWYPRVAVDWRPYYRGRWVTLRPYGWTWVGLDAFAWPTHHFGRWGFSAGAWYWIPGRTWGPAWVSWAYAPGYVSWCPLGWNNRAVIQINLFTRGYDPWRAWTVIPRRHFGGDYVNVHYIAGSRFDARAWRTFEPRYSAPASTGYAVPRSSAPIRVAGTVAPRRSPSPVYTNLEPGASRVAPGGRRVIVGEPRSTVAPGPAPDQRSRDDSYAVRRGTQADRDPRTSATPPQRSSGIPDPALSRRSPAGSEGNRTAVPSVPMYGGTSRGVAPSAPRDDDNSSRRSPGGVEMYGRRPPSGERPVYGGTAVPRERSDAGGSGTESRPYGGFERRAPGGERPQGPPADAGRPTAQPREYRPAPSPPSGPGGGDRGGPGSESGGGDRRGPGSDRGQAPSSPPAAGGGGHQRGGGQATGGRAVPRGRG